jgi:hypothetical protein
MRHVKSSPERRNTGEYKYHGGRFVLKIKDSGTSKEIYEAGYVVQGFRDKKKTSPVHDADRTRSDFRL